MEYPVTKNILFDYFNGNASPLQEKLIKEWLEIPANGEWFYQCLAEWEAEKLQYVPNTNQALSSFMNRLRHDQEPQSQVLPETNSRQTSFRIGYWLKVACLAVLVVGSGVFLGKDWLLYKTYATSFGETHSFLLADHSQVTLNANSALKVPRFAFNGRPREVWLSGEAFFSITKQADHAAFRVHTPKLTIEVLGTKFNVTQRRGHTSVVLSEGKVKVIPESSLRLDTLLLKPGERIEYKTGQTQLVKQVVKPEKYTAWRENKLVFEQTPLIEVVQTIEDFYGISIGLADPAMARKKFTSTLPTHDVTVVLNSLSSVFGLEVVRQNGQIILR